MSFLKGRSVKVKELQEKCIIKAFKLSHQEQYKHVGPKSQDHKMSRFQDYVKRLCLDDDLKKIKITFTSSQRYKSKPKVKDHYNISQVNNETLKTMELRPKDQSIKWDIRLRQASTEQTHKDASDEVLDIHHGPIDAKHNPPDAQPSLATQGLSKDSCFISHGDYTHFYRLSHSELVGIEKVAVCSSL
ncbi:hypothetical protein Tco_0205989 [Tanacetum coccineum]